LNTDLSIFPLTHVARNCHPGRSTRSALTLAFLSVIPEGNLLLVSALALAFLSVIPEGNLLLASALALAFLAVIPEGNLLLHSPLKPPN
jgi:hypothetical protein